MNKEYYIKEYKSRINKVLDYIENNIENELNLDTLADIANFSRFHFHRIFRSLMNEPLNKFVRRLRLERAACILLLNKEKTITEIAYETGFTGSAVFAKAFKNHFQMSASEWIIKESESKSKNGQTISKNSKTDSKNGIFNNTSTPYFRGINSNQKNKSVMEEKILKKIEVKKMPEMHVAYVRHVGPYQNDKDLFAGMIKKIMNWAGPRNLIRFPETKLINVYHDNPNITEDSKLRTSICITVPENTKVGGEIGKMKLESAECVIGNFELNSDKFGDAWSYMYNWIMENGFQPDDKLAFEINLNEPSEHPENKHIVDICVPIKPL